MSEITAYERLGGDASLKIIIDDFVERVTCDLMIGFFFRKVDKERLKLLEKQFAAGHLGGPQTYEGRPVRSAHAPHPIMGGHFNRRMVILEKTLRDHAVPEEVRAEWLAHNASLRAHITADGTTECNDPLGAAGQQARAARLAAREEASAKEEARSAKGEHPHSADNQEDTE